MFATNSNRTDAFLSNYLGISATTLSLRTCPSFELILSTVIHLDIYQEEIFRKSSRRETKKASEDLTSKFWAFQNSEKYFDETIEFLEVIYYIVNTQRKDLSVTFW